MITSSKFFNKSFFTLQLNQQAQKNKIKLDDVSPWSQSPSRATLDQKYKNQESSIQFKKKQYSSSQRGYQISKNSSLKYIQRKLRQRYPQKKQFSPSIQQYKKYYTIQEKLNQIQAASHKKYSDSFQFIKRIKNNKKKPQLFPEITINQYNDLKAKGSGYNNNNSIDQILERRRNRRKILQQFGSPIQKKSKNKSKIFKENPSLMNSLHHSVEGKGIVSSRYVCIAKNPQFSIHGQQTTKMLLDQQCQ